MKLRPLTRAARRRRDIDVAIAAYSAWRRESAAVRDAYRSWMRAARADASFAFATYRLALDREERAARAYARRLSRAQGRPELDVVRQLAQLSVVSGAA